MSEDGRGKHATGDSEEDSLLRDVARAPDRAPADADPTRLAHFRILGRLGAGGMGVVYRAEDEKLRRKVAVKVLPESLASDPERRRRFFREARAAAAVTHANIATVYEIDEADGHVFIAMELVQGETLRARMEAHATGLTHADALRIARDIARGLASAHESGIVHRDLKPENVMITPAGDAKILDFGLA
jgi:serine/threonine-protein kinase